MEAGLRTAKRGGPAGTNAPSEASEAVQPGIRHGMVLPFQPITLTFRDIHYFVDLPAVRYRARVSLRSAGVPMCDRAFALQDYITTVPFLFCCPVTDVHERSWTLVPD